MKPLISKLEQLISQGNELIKNIPKKVYYLEKENRIKKIYKNKLNEVSIEDSKRIKNQLNILWQEYKSKSMGVAEKYNDWFSESLKALKEYGKDANGKKFAESKNTLLLENKLKQGIRILKLQLLEIENRETNLKSENLISLENIPKPSQWKKIISNGESDKVEFKSSLRWDYNTSQLNKDLEFVVAKTIAAMLNSKGGILFIGVNDKGQIIGIEKDYPTLRKHDGDGFILYLLQVINNRLGKEFNRYISMRIEKIDEKDVCVIEITRSDAPVFVKYDNKEEFYIRASSSSQPLNIREAMEYVKNRYRI